MPSVKVLGVNAYHGDASAALLVGGQLIAFAAEERFNRIKHCAGFPEQAIRYCLKEAGLTLSQVDVVTVSKDPRANLFAKMLRSFAHPRLLSPAFLHSRFSQQNKIQDLRGRLSATLRRDDRESTPPVVHVEHHLAHAASAFFASPYDRAAILTLDGMGDGVSALL